MKITYDDLRSAPGTGIGPWVRRFVLLWLIAVTAEYLYLDEQLRDLTALAGIAEMSPVRMGAVAAVAAGLLFLLLRHLTDGTERLLLAGVYTVCLLYTSPSPRD